jgi:protein-tyrosine phosphatase
VANLFLSFRRNLFAHFCTQKGFLLNKKKPLATKFTIVPKMKKMKILMVCLGNICRSPLAEGIMKHKIQAAGLDWEVDSAGIGGWHAGELPDHRSIKMAAKNGIDITDQRARKLLNRDFDIFDYVFVMDDDNVSDVMGVAKTPQQKAKIHKILNFADSDSQEIVPDPYYDGRFQLVFNLLDGACDKILEKLQK